jgi:hypothetical protein
MLLLPLTSGAGQWTYSKHVLFDNNGHSYERGIRDKYTNDFQNDRSLAFINQAYGTPDLGALPDCRGLTASDGPWVYKLHEPSAHGDDGTVTPTALASFLYTPQAFMRAPEHF